jgi:parallel beta-helix repeat protein
MGEGSAVRDLAIDSAVHSTRGDKGGKPFTGNPANWAVENVWITHTNVGFWMSGASNGVIRGCRVRCTYADGINLNRGASNNLIENCSVRGTGDDGTAILADARDAIISSNNIVRHNTVTAVWWGANCDIAGGSGQIVEHNYWADNTSKECFTINLPASYPMHPQTGALISHNTIVRGGGYWGQRRGAMWIYAGSVPISNVSIVDNQILDPVSSGIHLAGNYQQQISVSHNTITNPGTDGIYIESTVQGTGAMSENTITGLKAGCVAVKNASKDFILTK